MQSGSYWAYREAGAFEGYDDDGPPHPDWPTECEHCGAALSAEPVEKSRLLGNSDDCWSYRDVMYVRPCGVCGQDTFCEAFGYTETLLHGKPYRPAIPAGEPEF